MCSLLVIFIQFFLIFTNLRVSNQKLFLTLTILVKQHLHKLKVS